MPRPGYPPYFDMGCGDNDMSKGEGDSMSLAHQTADDDLMELLDSHLWLARGGSVALGPPATLRKALSQAHMFSSKDGCGTSIVKLCEEEIHIAGDQINRLLEQDTGVVM